VTPPTLICFVSSCRKESTKRNDFVRINGDCYKIKKKQKRRELTQSIPKYTPTIKKIKKVRQKAPKQELPIIKGTTQAKKKQKINSYITFDERRLYFRLLIKSGLDSEKAKERIKQMLNQMNETAKKLRAAAKSEIELTEQIKINKQKLLEGLYG
jgi:hypothetical protein